jgi:hypothetical protein
LEVRKPRHTFCLMNDGSLTRLQRRSARSRRGCSPMLRSTTVRMEPRDCSRLRKCRAGPNVGRPGNRYPAGFRWARLPRGDVLCPDAFGNVRHDAGSRARVSRGPPRPHVSWGPTLRPSPCGTSACPARPSSWEPCANSGIRGRSRGRHSAGCPRSRARLLLDRNGAILGRRWQGLGAGVLVT